MSEDLADHVGERSRRVDHHAASWDVFLCSVESDDELTLGWFRSPLILRALVESLMQGFEINVEDEHLVEQIDELRGVARASAEERHGLLMVCDQRPHSSDVPDVMLVDSGIGRFTSLGVALVRKLPVAVDGLVATPVQLEAHRGLPRSGDAFDEIVADAHPGSIQPSCAVNQTRMLNAALRGDCRPPRSSP